MKNIRTFIYLILICAVMGVLPASHGAPGKDALNETELLASMEARLGKLMDLKLTGKVGETVDGLIEARETLVEPDQVLVAAENADRTRYYDLLASRLDVPLARIQEKRAEQIRKNSPDGVWLQSPEGRKWYQK